MKHLIRYPLPSEKGGNIFNELCLQNGRTWPEHGIDCLTYARQRSPGNTVDCATVVIAQRAAEQRHNPCRGGYTESKYIIKCAESETLDSSASPDLGRNIEYSVSTSACSPGESINYSEQHSSAATPAEGETARERERASER